MRRSKMEKQGKEKSEKAAKEGEEIRGEKNDIPMSFKLKTKCNLVQIEN